MAKNNTNKVAWLVIIGLVLSWVVAGFAAGFTGNPLIGVAMFLIMFSGVFGKKPMETVGSFVPIAAIVFMLVSGTFGDWWQWLLGVLIALFIGNALSNFRPDYKQEYQDYEAELKYNFVSADDGFTINFPKKPKLIEIGKNINPNHYTRQYQYDVNKNTSFSIAVSDIDEMPRTKKDLSEKLESELIPRGMAYGVLSPEYTKGEILDVACIDAVFQQQDGACFYNKIFLKNHKKYVIQFGINPENDSLFKNFVDSFKFKK